jgi:hypothetical protein
MLFFCLFLVMASLALIDFILAILLLVIGVVRCILSLLALANPKRTSNAVVKYVDIALSALFLMAMTGLVIVSRWKIDDKTGKT